MTVNETLRRLKYWETAVSTALFVASLITLINLTTTSSLIYFSFNLGQQPWLTDDFIFHHTLKLAAENVLTRVMLLTTVVMSSLVVYLCFGILRSIRERDMESMRGYIRRNWSLVYMLYFLNFLHISPEGNSTVNYTVAQFLLCFVLTFAMALVDILYSKYRAFYRPDVVLLSTDRRQERFSAFFTDPENFKLVSKLNTFAGVTVFFGAGLLFLNTLFSVFLFHASSDHELLAWLTWKIHSFYKVSEIASHQVFVKFMLLMTSVVSFAIFGCCLGVLAGILMKKPLLVQSSVNNIWSAVYVIYLLNFFHLCVYGKNIIDFNVAQVLVCYIFSFLIAPVDILTRKCRNIYKSRTQRVVRSTIIRPEKLQEATEEYFKAIVMN